jgi:type IV secretory pathway VirB2 component (pilin)
LFFSLNKQAGAESKAWWYVNIYNDVMGIGTSPQSSDVGYGNEKDCNIYRDDYIKQLPANIPTSPTPKYTKSTLPVCYESTVADRVKNRPGEGDVIDPSANNNTSDKDVYTLLAPIGEDFKTFDTGNGIGNYISTILKLAIGIASVLAVVMIIIGGIEWMGTDSIFGKVESKKRITSAILGLLIAMGAWALLNTINPKLLQIASTGIRYTPKSGGGYSGTLIGGGGANANKNVTEYDSYLRNAANKYGLSCTLLKAFMYAESGGNPNASSPAGAQGLIQLMPGTFREQTSSGANILDPQTNILAGATYISKLMKNGCNGDPISEVCDISKIQYLAASYNGGPGANKPSEKCSGMTIWQCPQTICNRGKNKGTNCYKETLIYAPRVEANFNKLTEKGWGC